VLDRKSRKVHIYQTSEVVGTRTSSRILRGAVRTEHRHGHLTPAPQPGPFRVSAVPLSNLAWQVYRRRSRHGQVLSPIAGAHGINGDTSLSYAACVLPPRPNLLRPERQLAQKRAVNAIVMHLGSSDFDSHGD
jgi:hypothetical protein